MSEHNEIDERLTWLLARAGDEWGPLGVLRAAAAMWPDALDGLHEHNKAVWDAGYSVGQRHELESASVPPGPCWHDSGVTFPGKRTSFRCDLLAGHAGAHEADRGILGGTAVWTS